MREREGRGREQAPATKHACTLLHWFILQMLSMLKLEGDPDLPGGVRGCLPGYTLAGNWNRSGAGTQTAHSDLGCRQQSWQFNY